MRKRRRRVGSALCVVAVMGAAVGIERAALAGPKYWDVNGAAVGSGGSGAWNASDLFWSDSGTGSPEAWTFGTSLETAVFGGTGGVVTLEISPFLKKDSIFTAGGYELAGGAAAQTITLEKDGVVPSFEVNIGGTGSVIIGRTGSTNGNRAVNIAGTANTDAYVFRVGADDSLEFRNTISNMLIRKDGAGTLILSGANTYTGQTAILAGTVRIRNNTATGTTAGGVTVSSGAALELENNITVGKEVLSLSGSGVGSNGALRNVSGNNTWTGVVTISGTSVIQSDSGLLELSGTVGKSSQLTVRGAGNVTISNTMSGGGILGKEGSGRLTLSGTHTHSGATNVTGGTLALTGSMISSAVTVSDTAPVKTATIEGTGTTGNLTINSGGTVAPGNSVGQLNVGAVATPRNADLNNGATYKWEIGDASGAAGTGYDLLKVNGTLTIGTGIVAVKVATVGAFTWNNAVSQAWTIAQATTISGFDPAKFTLDTAAFGAAPGSFTVGASGGNLQLQYTVPEPSSSLLLGGATLAMLMRRVRRMGVAPVCAKPLSSMR